jgi:hypothetical protein
MLSCRHRRRDPARPARIALATCVHLAGAQQLGHVEWLLRIGAAQHPNDRDYELALAEVVATRAAFEAELAAAIERHTRNGGPRHAG